MEYTLETSSETFINKIKKFLHYGNIMIDLETLSTRTNVHNKHCCRRIWIKW